MIEFLITTIGVILIANLAYTIWSFVALKRLTKQDSKVKLEDKYLVEHIIYTRSSLNLIYASIAIITFILAFLGYNLKDKITQEVTKEISAAAKVDLEELRTKANNIARLDSLATLKSIDLAKTSDRIRSILDEIKRNPQQLYVVQQLTVSVQQHKFKFSELKTINGVALPTFAKPPVMFWRAYDKESQLGIDINTTTDGIEFSPVSQTFYVDLWIYPIP